MGDVVDFATVGGYDASLTGALTSSVGFGAGTASDLDLFGLGTGGGAQGLATGADASYTNQYVDGSQGAAGQQMLESVPDTRYQLPPMANTTAAAAGALAPAATPAPQAPSATAGAASPAPVQPTTIKEPLVYTVKKGDTLSGIAEKQGIKSWHQIYDIAANKKVVGSDPNLIHPGQKLIIPGKFVEKPAPVAPAPADGGAAASSTFTPAVVPANAPAEVQKLYKQLNDVDAKRDEGARLLTDFFTQQQYAETDDSRATIEQAIQQTMADTATLDQIRQYIIMQLGSWAPQESTTDEFLQYGLGATL